MLGESRGLNVPLVFLEKRVIIHLYAPVAQWIMQQISNLWIAGSSPAGRASFFD